MGTSSSAPSHKAAFRLEDDYRKLGVQLEAVSLALGESTSPAEYAWVSVRRTWDRAGSYNELRDALNALQEHWPQGHAVVHAVWLRHVKVRMIGKARDVETVAVTWLAMQMPGMIRVPVWLLTDEMQARRYSFAQMVQAGYSASEIAQRLQMPRKRVKKMLRDLRASAA